MAGDGGRVEGDAVLAVGIFFTLETVKAAGGEECVRCRWVCQLMCIFVKWEGGCVQALQRTMAQRRASDRLAWKSFHSSRAMKNASKSETLLFLFSHFLCKSSTYLLRASLISMDLSLPTYLKEKLISLEVCFFIWLEMKSVKWS